MIVTMQGPEATPDVITPSPVKSLNRRHIVLNGGVPRDRYVPGAISTPTSKTPSPNCSSILLGGGSRTTEAFRPTDSMVSTRSSSTHCRTAFVSIRRWVRRQCRRSKDHPPRKIIAKMTKKDTYETLRLRTVSWVDTFAETASRPGGTRNWMARATMPTLTARADTDASRLDQMRTRPTTRA